MRPKRQKGQKELDREAMDRAIAAAFNRECQERERLLDQAYERGESACFAARLEAGFSPENHGWDCR